MVASQPGVQPKHRSAFELVERETPAHGTGGGPFRVLRYQPLSAFSGLFRNFAATDPSLDAIKSFADSFGLLGGNLRRRIVLYDQGRGGKHPMGFGEHVDDWVHEILVMRLAVDLWELAREGDADHLGRMIFWAPDDTAVSIRLVREWQGVEHVVTVREHDFEYEGRPYRSLSAVARGIAGSRWNGWLFFGLRKQSKGK